MQLLFATSNQNKAIEINAALPNNFSVLSLRDIFKDNIEVDEPYATLEENAIHKAQTYAKLSGMNCFSEDTGLEVIALHGEPGVKSARYAGEPSDAQKNIELLLTNLYNTSDRSAQFRTVIALYIDGTTHTFEGICRGNIIQVQRGANGFGYDPVFIPDGADKTFAEMTLEEKNMYSHRKKALKKMLDFFSTINLAH